MRRIEESALVSRWSERTVETCILCTGLGACALLIPTPLAGISVLGTVLVLASCLGIPLGNFMRKLLVASGFVLVSLLPMALRVAVQPFDAGWDPDGFRSGVQAGARALGTLSATLLLAFTTPFPRLVGLFRRMGFPVVATDLLGMVHRQIFLLDERSLRLERALASRGGWRNADTAARSLGYAAANLLVSAVVRSERLERGLASRGGIPTGVHGEGSSMEVRPLALAAAIAVPVSLALGILGGGRLLGL